MKALALASFFLSAVCHADIVIHPGDSIFVSSPQTVSCDGGVPGFAVQVCDCKPSSDFDSMGQAIGSGSDIASECQAMSPSYHPFSCHSLTLVQGQQIACDCKPSLDFQSMGQAIGTGKDIADQCHAMSSSYRPFNCQTQ